MFYLYSCPVLAWLYIHGQLVVPQQDRFIRSGRKLDEDRWRDKRSLDLSPYGKADWVTGPQSEPVIHEGSRGDRHSDPKRGQLRHYLWAADKLYGLEATGKLHISGNRTETVEADNEQVEEDHRRLAEMMDEPPPEPERIPICVGCTNKDWCWG